MTGPWKLCSSDTFTPISCFMQQLDRGELTWLRYYFITVSKFGEFFLILFFNYALSSGLNKSVTEKLPSLTPIKYYLY